MKQRIDPLEHVTLKQAAELFGVHYPTLWRMVRDGRVSAPSHLIPGSMRRYYNHAELKGVRRQYTDAMLNSRKVKVEAE